MPDNKKSNNTDTSAQLFDEIVANDDFDTEDMAAEKRDYLTSLTDEINAQAKESVAQIERGDYEDFDDVIAEMERFVEGEDSDDVITYSPH